MRDSMVLVLAGVLSFVAVPASAQQSAATAVEAPEQVVSASPLLWMFKWFNADYERRVSTNVTWGLSGSYLPAGDFDYGRASVLVRYYPQAALTGFYLGGQTGVYRIEGLGDREVRYGAGIDLGHAWLIGANENVAVSIGFGLSRTFGGDLEGASYVIPNARLVNVGIAF